MLIWLFQQAPIGWGLASVVTSLGGLGGSARSASPYTIVDLCPVPRPGKVWNAAIKLLASIMAKNKFIKMSLDLLATHAATGSEQPLLQVADGVVYQRRHGLRTFGQVDSRKIFGNAEVLCHPPLHREVRLIR